MGKEIKVKGSKVIKGPSTALRVRAFMFGGRARKKLKKMIEAENKKAAIGKSKANDKKNDGKSNTSLNEEVGASTAKQEPKKGKGEEKGVKVDFATSALVMNGGASVFLDTRAMITPLNETRGKELKNKPARDKTVTKTAKNTKTKVTKMKVS